MAILETVIDYIETRAATNSDLSGRVKVTRPKEPIPNIKDYGVRVSFGDGEWCVNKREKIGPIMTQHIKVNVDLVFNKQYTGKQVFTATKGISYWENVMTTIYANNTNGATFRDSYWTPVGSMEQNDESVIIKGILNIVVDTRY